MRQRTYFNPQVSVPATELQGPQQKGDPRETKHVTHTTREGGWAGWLAAPEPGKARVSLDRQVAPRPGGSASSSVPLARGAYGRRGELPTRTSAVETQAASERAPARPADLP